MRTGTPCPVSASAITDPKVAAELVDGRLQGAADRHRAARAAAACRAGSTSSSGIAPTLGGRRRDPRELTMSESLADHFAEQADEPAGRAGADLGRRARSPTASSQRWRRAPTAELEALELPADRPVGIRAKKSPEAIALILACLQARAPVPAAVGRAGARDARPSCSRRRAPAACSSPHGPRSESASLRAIEDAPAEEDEPAPSGRPPGGGDDISFMLTTSGSTGLPKIVPLPAGAVDRFTDWAADAVRHRPRHRRSRTTRRSTSTSACSTSGRRSSTAAASCSSTRTARPTAATSPI